VQALHSSSAEYWPTPWGMRILVVYGSKRGGTEGLARHIAATLAERGYDVDARSGREVDGVGSYHAVIVGGALYAHRWQRHARSFVRRHEGDLRELPVWTFSSGPLDHSASEKEIPPVPSVARLMNGIGARGHATFGGRLAPEANGFIAHAMVEGGHVGDFRDMDVAAAWARTIADELATLPTRATRPTDAIDRTLRRTLMVACWFTGLTALAGGLELMIWPRGNEVMPPVSMLEGTPFSSFFVPGLLLAALVGGLNAAAAMLARRRHRFAEHAAFVAGGALTVWIVVQMSMLRAVHWLHGVYLAAGVMTVVAATVWWLQRRRVPVQIDGGLALVVEPA
jgi:menaquinone-dependent protoporphyrinogen oxidase